MYHVTTDGTMLTISEHTEERELVQIACVRAELAMIAPDLQAELGAARRRYEGSQSALKKAMAELTEARAEALNVRPEVRRFALEMEIRLQDNDHKGGWKGECWMHLLDMLRDEVAELAHEVVNADANQVGHIVSEAADVGNFAMMIADACGGLE